MKELSFEQMERIEGGGIVDGACAVITLGGMGIGVRLLLGMTVGPLAVTAFTVGAIACGAYELMTQ